MARSIARRLATRPMRVTANCYCLIQAIRCSLEDFGHFDYIDSKAENAVRHVEIVPLYAISQIGG